MSPVSFLDEAVRSHYCDKYRDDVIGECVFIEKKKQTLQSE